MLTFGDIFAFIVSALAFQLIRWYFIFTSGERKTNLPFIKRFNLMRGSKDIIFCNNKVLAVNAHDRHLELKADTFGCWFGSTLQVFTRDPDLIYEVWVNSFRRNPNRYDLNSLSDYMKASLLEARDKEWQASRKAVGSVLKASKLKIDNVDHEIDESIKKMLESLDRRIKKAKSNGKEPVIDFYQVNKNFFMQSILKIVFNTYDMVDFDNEHNDVVEDLYKFINVNYEAIARACFLYPSLVHLVRPILPFFEHGKFLGLLTEKLEKIITRNEKTISKPRQDTSRLTTIHSLINSYKNRELTKTQLIGNAVFLMIASFASSVDTMAIMMWKLARNQKAQDKLRADLLQYGENSEYLKQCINETLRLYPTSLTNRDIQETVHYKDIRLVEGTCLNLSIYSLHRDPKWWGSDANEWKPERFDKSKTKDFHPAQFVPFGIGPRNCVGGNVAKLELEKFSVQLFLRYKLEVVEETSEKITFINLGALPYALPIAGPIMLKITAARCLDSSPKLDGLI